MLSLAAVFVMNVVRPHEGANVIGTNDWVVACGHHKNTFEDVFTQPNLQAPDFDFKVAR